jgi:hypothetical protein
MIPDHAAWIDERRGTEDEIWEHCGNDTPFQGLLPGCQECQALSLILSRRTTSSWIVLDYRGFINRIDIVLAIDMLRWLYSNSFREALGAITLVVPQ